jgi:hypothetical protein
MCQDVSVGENRLSGLRPGFAYQRRRGHHRGVSERQVHPVRALVGLNDHPHRSAGSPLSRLSDLAVHESRRTYLSVGRDLGTNQRLSKRSQTTGRILDETERRS